MAGADELERVYREEATQIRAALAARLGDVASHASVCPGRAPLRHPLTSTYERQASAFDTAP